MIRQKFNEEKVQTFIFKEFYDFSSS